MEWFSLNPRSAEGGLAMVEIIERTEKSVRKKKYWRRQEEEVEGLLWSLAYKKKEKKKEGNK